MMPPIMTVPSMTTSHSNSGALSRYILFGPKEDEADHSRYGPLAQLAKLEGEAAITIQKRKERKNAFSHVGGYSTVKILMNKGAHLKAKLNVNQTFVEVIGEDDEGNPKEKRTTKVVDAGEPTVEIYNKLKVYTWKLKDTTSIAKMYLSGNAEIYAIAADGAYGVAVDNVAMRGSSGTIFHRIDSELLAESYKAMNARLIIMEYGGNLRARIPATSNGQRKLSPARFKPFKRRTPMQTFFSSAPPTWHAKKTGNGKLTPGLT